MNCRDMEQNIALYVGGDLDPAEAAVVAAHLEGCEQCRALAWDLEAAQAAVSSLGEELPDELRQTAWRRGLMERITAKPARRFAWPWVWAATTATAAAVLVVLSYPSAAPLVPEPQLVRWAPPAPEVVAPRPAPVRTVRHHKRRPPPEEPLLVRLETADPDVVIYWIIENKGG